jgi:predicted nuclease of predicted toxin-antitoxin system
MRLLVDENLSARIAARLVMLGMTRCTSRPSASVVPTIL